MKSFRLPAGVGDIVTGPADWPLLQAQRPPSKGRTMATGQLGSWPVAMR